MFLNQNADSNLFTKFLILNYFTVSVYNLFLEVLYYKINPEYLRFSIIQKFRMAAKTSCPRYQKWFFGLHFGLGTLPSTFYSFIFFLHSWIPNWPQKLPPYIVNNIINLYKKLKKKTFFSLLSLTIFYQEHYFPLGTKNHFGLGTQITFDLAM